MRTHRVLAVVLSVSALLVLDVRDARSIDVTDYRDRTSESLSTVVSVPEPGTLLLLGSGLTAVASLARRGRAR